MGKAIKSPITIFLSLDPITWKVGRANKKVVVLCIKHPNQIFNICSNIKFDKYDETLLRVAQKTWIKKYLRNFYVSQMSWAEQIEHLQLSEVGKWSNIQGAISEILLNIYLCLHFTKYVFTKYIFMVTFYLFKNISVTKLGWICWRPNPTSTKSNMKLK